MAPDCAAVPSQPGRFYQKARFSWLSCRLIQPGAVKTVDNGCRITAISQKFVWQWLRCQVKTGKPNSHVKVWPG
jgi:hypothetical protein